MELGKRLQACREAGGVTQLEMGKVCGVHKNYISAMERGINKPGAEILLRYAEKLNMSLDKLIYGEAPSPAVLPELMEFLKTMSKEEQEKVLRIAKILKGVE